MSVADELATVSRVLAEAQDVGTTLTASCRLAVEHVPGCEEAGIVLVLRGSMQSVGSTSAVAEAVDALQFDYAEGPSLDALKTPEVVQVDDLTTDPRWPSVGPAVVRSTGIRSVLAHRLEAGDRILGAISLCSSKPRAFDGDPRTAHLASLFATHASVALAAAQSQEGLRVALESRETISVAMGILMVRQGITRAQAFDVLRRASQRENVKLRDIAARIADGVEESLAAR